MTQVQKILMTTLVIVVVAGIFITLTRSYGQTETALFYIGLPAILAIGLILSKRSEKPMPRTMKGITLGILLSGPLLQEGFICMLMAAPIFYAVGALVAWAIGKQDAKQKNQLKTFTPFVVLMLMSLEGTHPNLTFPRETIITVSKVVNLSTEQLANNLNQPVKYGKDASLFLKLFPFPEITQHSGTQVGDQQTMHFVYRRHFVSDRNVHEGDIVFEVTERDETHIKSKVVSDTSYLSTYMVWQTSEVSWLAINNQSSRVTWKIKYQRKLDPAWYFGPLQQFVTEMAAETLIDSVVASSTGIPAVTAIPAGHFSLSEMNLGLRMDSPLQGNDKKTADKALHRHTRRAPYPQGTFPAVIVIPAKAGIHQ